MPHPWTLVREIGLEHAGPAAREDRLELLCPVAAERIPGLGHLFVDDASADGDPLRMRCRTRVVSFEGSVLFDSLSAGFDEAYGCRLGDDRLALLRTDRGELLVTSHAGEILRSIDVSHLSPHRPRLVAATPKGTLLLAYLGNFQDVGFAEVDASGRVLWAVRETVPPIGIPGSVQLLPQGTILVADEFHMVVWELARDGSAAIRWGRFRAPSSALGDLHRPRCARRLDDGTLLIADAHNHRVLAITPGGHATPIRPAEGELVAPAFVDRLENGHHLVCDAGSRSIVELDAHGRIAWSEGRALVRRRLFSFPRSVEHRGGSRYLVADSAHNRVVEVEPQALRERLASSGPALFWPRAVRSTRRGGLLIADGRNARIVELAADGRVVHELAGTRFDGRDIAFRDPHDIRMLPNGRLLVVDSAQHMVLETDWSGRASWVIGGEGGELRDPHTAQPLADGRILVTDRGHDRLLFVDPSSGRRESISELHDGDRAWPLKAPRHATLSEDGMLVIADTANNRVLVSSLRGDFVLELSRIPDSPTPWLRFPRWAERVAPREIVVSDYANHRIVHVRLPVQ